MQELRDMVDVVAGGDDTVLLVAGVVEEVITLQGARGMTPRQVIAKSKKLAEKEGTWVFADEDGNPLDPDEPLGDVREVQAVREAGVKGS